MGICELKLVDNEGMWASAWVLSCEGGEREIGWERIRVRRKCRVAGLHQKRRGGARFSSERAKETDVWGFGFAGRREKQEVDR